ncbi:MAG: hypothetical protein AAF631_02915 [Pseudomonadota bacterium]
MMKPSPETRGGAPVGYLNELGPIEASAIVYLRLWCDSPAAREQIAVDFEVALGPRGGEDAVAVLGALCDACVENGRRPLLRHDVTCRCMGGDEACFAHMVAAAIEGAGFEGVNGKARDGATQDAFLLASNIVNPRAARPLVLLARRFGLALRRIVGQQEIPIHDPLPNTQPTIH